MMIVNSRPFKTKRLTRTIAVLLSLCASTGVAMAQEGEQFSLTQQPSMLFDDGGSGTLTGSVNGIPYEIVQGHAIAQGDMVLGRLFADGRLEIPAQARGLGLAGEFDRWPDGIVPFQFQNDVSQIQRDRALEAIAHWNAKTGMKLVSRNADNEEDYKDYITFETSNGCASWVGRVGGEQAVWLADSCTVGSIIHEIGHAIGLFHEHTRPDRDNYVTVNLNNVSSGKEINFEKIEAGAANFSDYDYGSIMHYGEYFFSNNGERSISAPDGVTVGQREALSDDDAKSVNQMYATDLRLDVTTEALDKNTRIDVLVSNIGALGANTLKLTASMPANSDWLSVSAESGWDCRQFENELRCTRPTLAERRDSSFSILVDPGTDSINELTVRIESRTLDTELNNNVLNDTISVAVAPSSAETEANANSTAVEAEPATPTATTDADTTIANTVKPVQPATPVAASTNEPAIGAATSGEPVAEAPNAPAAASSGESSGGGAAIYLLFLMLMGRVTQFCLRK